VTQITLYWLRSDYIGDMGIQGRGRRRLIQGSLALAGLGLLSGCGRLGWQAPPRVPRIGYLDSLANQLTFEPFREGMHDLGYVDGENVAIEYRNAEGDLQRLPALVAELLGQPVEVIVVPNPVVARAVRNASPTIPIVASGGNVVAAGLVTNIAHPEGNLTGVTTNSVEVVGKWVELLKETVPATARLGMVLDLSGPSAQAFVSQVERAARQLQLPYTPYDVRDLDQLQAVLSLAQADGTDGFVVVSGGALGGGNDPRIGAAVLQSRLAAVAELRSFAVAGGLLAHGASTAVLAKRSASFVDKVLKGTQPSDLPIELPTVFDIVVNLKTARTLGLTIPSSILRQATETIQ
jgi:putative ABC transport system substrate-binding protein